MTHDMAHDMAHIQGGRRQLLTLSATAAAILTELAPPSKLLRLATEPGEVDAVRSYAATWITKAVDKYLAGGSSEDQFLVHLLVLGHALLAPVQPIEDKSA